MKKFIRFNSLKQAVFVLFMLCCIKSSYAQPGSIDPRFNPTDTGFANGEGSGPAGTDTRINATAVLSDGKIITAGVFTTYNGVAVNSIARLNADGRIDTSFRQALTHIDNIMAIAILPNGKILIGGSDNASYPNNIGVVCLNADGSLDPTFNLGVGIKDNYMPSITAIQPLADGKILVGGRFTSYNGMNRTSLARLNADGSIDASFNPNLTASFACIVNTISVQADSKIIVAGVFDKNIARFNADGSMDASFKVGTGVNNDVNVTCIQPDGKIVVGGSFTQYNDTAYHCIVRINPNGSIDRSFNVVASDIITTTIKSMQLQPDLKIVIATFISNKSTITRLNVNGSVDAQFNTGTGASSLIASFPPIINSVSLQPDGKIICGGQCSSFNGVGINNEIRLNTNGSLDNSFVHLGTGANGVVQQALLLPNGKTLIAGDFTAYNGANRMRMAMLNADGSLDPSFNLQANLDRINTMIAQPDGKIILAVGPNLLRINANGTQDNTFSIKYADNGISAVALQADGKIIIAGDFGSFNGVLSFGIARLNANGTLDNSFNNHTDTLINRSPNLSVLASGKILSVCGNGIIYRYNSNGSIDNTFSINDTYYYGKFSVLPDGKIIGAVKAKTAPNSVHLVRLNADGSIDNTFQQGSGVNGTMSTFIAQPDGKVIAFGKFSMYNGVACNNVVRLSTDGSVDGTFNSGLGANGPVYGALLPTDSSIFIVGDFTAYNGTGRNHVALLLNQVMPLPSYTVSFNVDGGTPVADITVIGNALLPVPTAPSKTNYFFAGWYKEATYTNAWNFESDIVTAPITLYAKWSTSNLVNNIEANGLHIFPNPASDIIHIDNIAATTEIEIYNIDGKLVKQQKVLSNNAGIDIQSLTNGLYALVIYSSEGVKSVKFVKK